MTTAAALTKVNGPKNSDAAVGAALLDQDTTLPAPAGPDEEGDEDDEQVEVLSDSAYGSGDMLDRLEKAERNARNGPGARLADQAASTSTPRTCARPALLIRPCTGAELPD